MHKKGSVDSSDYLSLAIGGFAVVLLFILIWNNTAEAKSEIKIKIEEKRILLDSYGILNDFIEQNRNLITRDYIGKKQLPDKLRITRAFTAKHKDELAYNAADYFYKHFGLRNIEWALEVRDSSGKDVNRIESYNFNKKYRTQNSITLEFPGPNKDYIVFRLFYREVG